MMVKPLLARRASFEMPSADRSERSPANKAKPDFSVVRFASPSLRGYFHRRAKSDVAQLDDRVVVLQAEKTLRRAKAEQR